MIEFLTLFKDQIVLFLNYMLPIATIACMTLGFVSIAGRLWEAVKTDHAKNIIASFSLVSLSFLYQRSMVLDYDLVWDTLELLTMSSIFYIGFCWRFYSRLDTFLDKKMGKDNFKPTKKRKSNGKN